MYECPKYCAHYCGCGYEKAACAQQIHAQECCNCLEEVGGWGVLLTIFDGGVLPRSPNPDPSSDPNMLFPKTWFQTSPLNSIPIF